jgi:AAA domain
MPLTGFEGPAGTGKTHALIDAVRVRLLAVPVLTHQRVLALTFMHGSRRRLTERFSQHIETRGKVDCMTVDSFALNVLRRWHALAGLTPEGFEAICDACGGLLENPQIAKWVSATYPIVVIDEAQELAPCRLRIVQALAAHTDMFAAADEFQCLNEAVDTAPFMAWFRTGNVTLLHRVRRTSRPGLLEAGISLRHGRSPAIGTGLAIGHTFPNQAPFSIGHALARATGSTAVLVAPGAKGWADAMIPRWVQGMQTPRQTVRPMPIAWEAGAALEAASVLTQICAGASATAVELERQILGLAEAPLWLPSALTAIRHPTHCKVSPASL